MLTYPARFLFSMQFPSTHPTVLGTIITAAGLRRLARASGPANAAEVRVDALLAAKISMEKIEQALQKRKQPVLLTLRIPAEGGHRPWKTKERREIFLRLLTQVDAIDVELATARAMQPVIEAARATGKTVIFSAHAIARPASAAQIAKWTRQFKPGADTILKIAAQIKSWRDLQQLAALLINHPEWSIAAMGLGPHAAQSRSVLTALGSCLVYGYLDQPAAPGQPSAAEVRKMVQAVALS
jgi:3-dehydroquinate dehydratase-1